MTGFIPVPPDPWVPTATNSETKLFPDATMDALDEHNDGRYATTEQGEKADSAYQLPEDGVPATDLEDAVQTSLRKADEAVPNTVEGRTALAASPELGAAYVERTQLEVRERIARITRFFGKPQGFYIGRSGTTYNIYQALTSGLYWKASLEAATYAGGGPVHQLGDQALVSPVHQVDDGSLTMSGSGWSTSSAGGFGGSYQRSAAAGAAATYTTPSGVSRVFLGVVRADFGGIVKVAIDGDPTAATYLPTAQQMVDRGYLASTALVANGGTLAPTDRVLDLYNSSTLYSRWMLLAEGLAPRAHTIVVTNTGYKRSAASDTRIMIDGVGYGLPGEAPGASGTSEVYVTTMRDAATPSAWEYVYRIKPAGAAAFEWAGNSHGYEYETSLAIAVDGANVTLSDGQIVRVATLATITRESNLRHPETGSSHVADVVTTYTMDRDGLQVRVHTAWQLDVTVVEAYAMLPLTGPLVSTPRARFDRGQIDGWIGSALVSTGVAGDVYLGSSESAAIVLWESAGIIGEGRGSGCLAAAIFMEDIAAFTNDFAASGPRLTAMEDRNGLLTKGYISKAGGTAVSVQAGETWDDTTHYRFAWSLRITDRFEIL